MHFVSKLYSVGLSHFFLHNYPIVFFVHYNNFSDIRTRSLYVLASSFGFRVVLIRGRFFRFAVQSSLQLPSGSLLALIPNQSVSTDMRRAANSFLDVSERLQFMLQTRSSCILLVQFMGYLVSGSNISVVASTPSFMFSVSFLLFRLLSKILFSKLHFLLIVSK